ncbi:hypothetical protein PFICI_06550 [Pestalotiopsis fici W106-1]|uniref:NACHT domain-containing protein n=1 Tax=Pestalotiopsis fici (strain W106-1 / CGMCC3.15140) TaxID=1229662 RepID=W3X5Z2_PESFW|nr:uncharacterized protein PFICI_06550 [Pestalotiopsis fici W106-1]ETS81548.1 hypothetical protein PFICI_06550 [Pestalotiopsis fici W106-1]
MYLLRIEPNREVAIVEFISGLQVPEYAILSHTWEPNHKDEVIFRDFAILEEDLDTGQDVRFCTQRGKEKTGYRKIRFCAEQAERDGFQYFWIDSCCIDKANAAELSESINSMFRWYQEAIRCYVYLSDVSKSSNDDGLMGTTWEDEFQGSRWHTRGWTLQELLASTVVDFFSSDGHRLGDKQSLGQMIHDITHIPIEALHGRPLSKYTIAERISWGRNRQTTRGEDKAYSLLGIMNVTIGANYGEGEEGAFKRLHRAIQDDQDIPVRDPELKKSLDECLANLRLSDPQDDKSRIEATKGGLFKDAYRWVLENPDYKKWRFDQESRLLWIKGDPGKGKTMLLCGLVDEMSLSPTSNLVHYFFCQATDSRLDNAAAVIRGLMYMLAKNDRSLLKHVHEEWRVAGKALFEDGNAWQAITRIFTAMTQEQQTAKLVFVIDALDECLKDLPKLLDFIAQQSRHGHAKWLVSSRNWPSIEEKLNATHQRVRLSLELNEASVTAAIETYIRYETELLAKSKNLDEPRKMKIREYLTLNANYTFLWVALVCQRLKDPKVRRGSIMKELQQYPADLYPLYQRMMETIDTLPDAELCHEILGVVSVVYRPIDLRELNVLLESNSLDDLDDLREVVDSCGSFLTIRDNTVYFVHQSAKDFLVTEAIQLVFPRGIKHMHFSVSKASITALLQGLHQDICALRKPGTSVEEISSKSLSSLVPIQYSCVYWVDHLTDGELHNGYMDSIRNFLEQKYLYWLEALSLIRAPISIPALSKLSRFIKYYGTIISQYPLQTYAAALVFSPSKSVIWKLFQKQMPDWVSFKPRTQEHWSALQQTLEGHTDYVLSVAFSPDGRQVASAS